LEIKLNYLFKNFKNGNIIIVVIFFKLLLLLNLNFRHSSIG